MAERARIPNLDTISTLIDRLSIENVKVAHFENAVEHDGPSSQEAEVLRSKIGVQVRIIDALKEELTGALEEVLVSGEYRYIKEERTFS